VHLFNVAKRVERRLALAPALSPKERERDHGLIQM
jgi:hypothetical protein